MKKKDPWKENFRGVRQGDVSLHPIETLPDGVKLCKNNILALGEITGHQHRLQSNQLCVFEDEQKNKFVNLKQDCLLVHDFEGGKGVFSVEEATKKDKHLAKQVLAGVYAVRIEQEYDPFLDALREVQD